MFRHFGKYHQVQQSQRKRKPNKGETQTHLKIDTHKINTYVLKQNIEDLNDLMDKFQENHTVNNDFIAKTRRRRTGGRTDRQQKPSHDISYAAQKPVKLKILQ